MSRTVLQSVKEEICNACSHGLGVIVSLIALIMMTSKAIQSGGATEIVSCVIFGTTLILMYASSTLYHSVQSPRKKQLLRICDHIMIYFLISGSYTPVLLMGLKGTWGWTLFIIVWTMAALGLIFKLFFTGKLERLSLGIYLGMGWLLVVAIQPLCESVHPGGLMWLFAGGGAYSLGTIFYAFDQRIPFFHAIWHLFVLTGSACHIKAVFSYLIPAQLMTPFTG